MDFPFLQFIDSAVDYGAPFAVEYDLLLVTVSYLIATVACSAGLAISEYIKHDLGGRRTLPWFLLGAIMLGLGVWAMHFIGMLAATLPVPVSYDVRVTLVSVLPAVVAGGVCLAAISLPKYGNVAMSLAGAAMGLGIGTMHYIGMAAMRLSVDMRYDVVPFVLSIVTAVILAVAALHIITHAIAGHVSSRHSLIMAGGVVMGLAITAMHYTGMWAARFYPLESATVDFPGLNHDRLAAMVAITTLAIVGLAVAAMALARRLAVERLLQRSEARLVAAQRIARVGSWEVDLVTNEESWSQETIRLFGEESRTFKPGRDNFLQRVHPDDRGAVSEMLDIALASGEPVEREYRILLANGSRRTMCSRGEITRDAKGRAIAWLGTVEDVTERRRAEVRLSNFLIGAPDALLVVNKQGNINFANARALTLFGYSMEELIGSSVSTLIPVEQRSAHAGHMSGYFRNPQNREMQRAAMEFRAVRKNGTQVPVEIILSPLEDDGEKLVVCAVRDITTRKEIEAALRASEAQYRMIADTAHEGIWILDRDANITYLNQRMAHIFGYTSEEMLGRSSFEYLHEDTRQEVESRFAQRRDGMSDQYVTRARHRDGSEVWISVAAAAVTDDEGNFGGTLTMVSDITERRQLEAQLRQSQKMEAVGQLTGGIAHDFNNLLAVVIGNLELVVEDVKHDERLAGPVQDAMDAGLRGADLTRRLLAFSRRQMLAPKVIATDTLVRQIKPLLRRALGENIRLKTVTASGLWLTEVDPSQLENVLINLGINARDAMPNGGQLIIETSNTRLAESDVIGDEEITAGEYVQLTVRDSGSGMSEEVLQRAFEPFFTTKSVAKGSGLGLSMVYGFVKQSKGHIDVDSKEGEGTTIRIYLPRSRSDDNDTFATGTNKTLLPHGHETVLVVEDNEAVRRVSGKLLTNLGYRVLEAGTGAEALATLEENKNIDLVFSDILMPGGMTGIELARHVHKRNPGLKVLLTSGYADTNIYDSDFLRGGNAVLEKPYRLDQLAQTVREVLDRQ